MMLLEGSCHCGAVRFSLRSRHPYPFNFCYCSICRKTTGGGGFAINLSGDHATLEVTGRDHVHLYRARMGEGSEAAAHVSPAERHFCALCGSHLWLWDPRWPELVHPLAAAIGPRDRQFAEYPKESIAEWHQRLGLISAS
jgi:hypothetical protein